MSLYLIYRGNNFYPIQQLNEHIIKKVSISYCAKFAVIVDINDDAIKLSVLL